MKMFPVFMILCLNFRSVGLSAAKNDTLEEKSPGFLAEKRGVQTLPFDLGRRGKTSLQASTAALPHHV